MKLRLISVFDYRLPWVILALVCVIAGFLSMSLEEAVLISDVHLDGVYQTMSAMTRVSRGDVVGKDFYFYLGIGPLYSLYPVFIALGGDVAASIVASHLVVKLSFLGTFIFFSRLVFPKVIWASVILFAVFAYLILEYVFIHYGFYIGYPDFFTYLDPGNSLKPLRRLAPVLGAICVYSVRKIQNPNTKIIFYGIVSGTLASWSNDYGIPTAFAVLVFVFWESYQANGGIKKYLETFGLFGVVATGWFLLFLWLVTQGHVSEWLSYNFESVSGDQWWYYKPYLKERIWQLSDLKMLLNRGGNWPLSLGLLVATITLPILLFRAFAYSSLNMLLMFYVGVCLVGGALISEIFGHLDDYYWAGIMPWLLFAVISLLIAIKLPSFKLRMTALRGMKRVSLSLACGVLVFLSLTKAMASYLLYADSIEYHRNRDVYAAELGGYVNAETKDYLDYMAKLMSGRTEGERVALVEEYFGLASALGMSDSPVPFDSVIHALGEPSRALYLQNLVQVEYVTTTNPEFSPWQSWSLGQNWWFYRYVLEHFALIEKFDNVVLWRRKAVKNAFDQGETIGCEVKSGDYGYSFMLSPERREEGIVELELDYAIETRVGTRVLVVLQHGLSHINQYSSLNLNTTHARIPVYLTEERQKNGVRMIVLPEGNGDNHLSISKCQARFVDADLGGVFFDDRYVPVDLDLGDFIDGMSLTDPVFYVLNSEANKKAYHKAARIGFSNGEARTIIEVQEFQWSGKLRVEYSGDSLAGEDVGYPNKIVVME